MRTTGSWLLNANAVVTPMASEFESLADERDFLLRSLTDLEAEFAAGDVDEDDYRELRDGYTARAAAVIRALAADDAPPARRFRLGGSKRLIAILITVALAGALSWAVAASSGQRLAGQQITGLDPRDEISVLLAEARAGSMADPLAAAALYESVIELDPDNVEALTYRGWTLALAARQESDAEVAGERLAVAVDSLVAAVRADPTYADPLCFLGIIQYRFVGDAESAAPLVAACLDADPPAMVLSLMEGIAIELGLVAESAG
jgi:tetratricopeptide (TPR) repeat protein